LAVNPDRERLRVHSTLIAVQVAFASLAITGKVILRSIEPGALALIRLGGAALVFSLVHRGRGLSAVPRRDALTIVGCALVGFFANQELYLHGLVHTSPVNATVLVSTVPVFTTFFGIILGRERSSLRAVGGVALAFASVLWLTSTDFALGGETALGDLFVVANSLLYALYLVLARGVLSRHGSLTMVTIGFAVSAVAALPFGLPSLLENAPSWPASTWALLAYAVLVATVFTYLGNAWALARAPSSIVSIYIYLQPLLAAAMAWAFLGELVSARVWITMAGVVAGIWLATSSRTTQQKPVAKNAAQESA
jgi:drug/metabolite transporter (DMT)-like permease